MQNQLLIGFRFFKVKGKCSSMTLGIILFLASLLTPVASFSETTIYRLTGQSATAAFYSLDPSGCLTIDFYLSSYNETEISAPGRESSPTGVFLMLSRNNVCTNIYSSGTALSGDLQLKMNPAMTNATLEGTIPICLYTWPNPTPSCTNLIVNLAWSGRGEVYRQSFNNRFTNLYPYSMVTERNNSNSRDALVTGDVFDGTTNLTPADAFQWGVLGFSQQRTLTIYSNK
jgi:hypothetical protein